MTILQNYTQTERFTTLNYICTCINIHHFNVMYKHNLETGNTLWDKFGISCLVLI